MDCDAVISRADVDGPERAEGGVDCEDDFSSSGCEAMVESRLGENRYFGISYVHRRAIGVSCSRATAPRCFLE